MPLFGFGDITINKNSNRTFGPLAALEGTEFQKNTFRYPMDVGSTDKGHYMVIYIREQNKTSLANKGTPAIEDIPITSSGTAASQMLGGKLGTTASKFGGGLLSGVNGALNQVNSATGGSIAGLTNMASQSISSALGGLNKIGGSIGNLFGQTSIFNGSSESTRSVIDTSIKKITNKSFLKTTTRTTDAIALYMPDTVMFNYQQGYDNIEIGAELGGQIAAAGVSAADAFKSGAGLKDALKKAAVSTGKSAILAGGKKVSEVAGTLGVGENSAKLGFTAVTGVVQNPMLELIYKSPNFRTFQFDFMFYPRDEREALEVQKIIERLRFHQAPELLKDAQGFLIPPSEFDIAFYYNNAQNPNLPPISTCVLTTIDANYAPSGWSAYEIPGENSPALGRTGMPVAIQLTLQFQETTYLTKDDFRKF